MFYEAQLSIYCIDGELYAYQGKDIPQMLRFLLDHDHEGSALTLVVRRDPDTWEEIDNPEQIYKELGWQ